jgi:hypothetical protein
MAESHRQKDAPQSGAKVALGILAFIVGLFVLLWIVKGIFGF